MSGFKEKTLVILKPDALQRNLLGEIIARFERKGLKIVGMKMMELDDVVLTEHYIHHKDRPFFKKLKDFMMQSPCVVVCLEGMESVKVVRDLCGPTLGRVAPAGTIRGDFSMSIQANIIHSSDSLETAKEEVKRFFKENEIHEYKKADTNLVYIEEERN